MVNLMLADAIRIDYTSNAKERQPAEDKVIDLSTEEGYRELNRFLNGT